METFLLVLVIVEAVIIAGQTFWTVKTAMTRKKIMEKADAIVKGRLDIEDICLNGMARGDGVVANAVNAIKTNLMTFVEATKVNVVTLADAITVLSKGAENNRTGNEQIAQGATNASMKSAEQLRLVKDNLDIIAANNAEMKEIENEMGEIRTILNSSVDNSKSGLNHLEGYERAIEAMSDDLNNINRILGKFNQDIKRIEEVGDFIIGISGRLRLLALNASVETARAGEAGKGFAVVANEVNGISIKTKEGMESINQIVKEIMQSSQRVNDSILHCEETYDQSKETFAIVNASFRSINDKSMEIQGKMNSIAGKFDMMTKYTGESKEKAEGLYNASQVISENMSEIASVSQEVAAESSTLSENTDALAGMLEGIEHLIGQFHTAIVPTKKRFNKTVKLLSVSMLDNDFWYGVRRGALYAKKELEGANAILDYIPLLPEMDSEKECSEAIERAIRENYDGVIYPGFLSGIEDVLKKAESHGLKLMTYNCDGSPKIKRVACLKPDPTEPGRILARAVERALDRKGRVALIIGNLSVGSNSERREAFLDYLRQNTRLEVISEISVGDDAESVYQKTLEFLKKEPGVDAMMITTGNPVAAAKAIEDAHRAGKVKLYTFDSNEEIFRYIKKGIIGTTVVQDAFGQGHDPAIWLYNHIVENTPAPKEFIPCRLSTVDKTNVENLINA